MGTKQLFKKAGGFNLIKQYHRGGALFTSCMEFLLLGKSMKALEILRLSANFKIKENLKKKYKKNISSFLTNYRDFGKHDISNYIWVCWLQGLDQAPYIVKKCFESLKTKLTSKNVILITEKNMNDYVTFPNFIIKKWKKGYISNTHLTDLLRLELLIKYGGTWIDSTVLCTCNECDIPNYFFESDLFLYQTSKPGRDGHSQYVSSWYINAKSNNKILMMTRYLCYEYWKKNNKLVDYFLFHDFLTISLEYNEEKWKNIIPRDNSSPHYLLLRLFDQYDERMWESIMEQTPFHKLTYKFNDENEKKTNTYYDKLLKIDGGDYEK